MSGKRYILSTLLILLTVGAFAQKAERDHIRKGNKAYKDSLFVDADVNYRKALEINPQSTISMFNLGNTLTNQEKFEDALKQYTAAADIEKDKMKLSQIYHNIGVLFQAGKQYEQAIEAYKRALRNNPLDDETRYNLELAQKLLEQQDDNQDNQDQQDQQDQENQQDQQDQQDQQQNQQDQNQENQPPEPDENEISKENAEQMLNSVMQDERDVQEKVKQKQQIIQGGRLEKEW